ncbi:hypothetical protein Hanom_Chr01g00077421 [Helianthus anomalus]
MEQTEGNNEGGGPGSVNVGILNNNDDVLSSKNGGAFSILGGAFSIPGGVLFSSRKDNGPVSLSNSFNMGRPKLPSRIPRPRNKNSESSANVSPTSDPRPKKRLREHSEFAFDLNKQAAEGSLSTASRLDDAGVKVFSGQDVDADQAPQAVPEIFTHFNSEEISRQEERDVQPVTEFGENSGGGS